MTDLKYQCLVWLAVLQTVKVEEGNMFIRRISPKHVRKNSLQTSTTSGIFSLWLANQQWTWFIIRHWSWEDESKKTAVPYSRASIKVTSRREKKWKRLNDPGIMSIRWLQISWAWSLNCEVIRDKPVSLISSCSERVESSMECHNADDLTSPEGLVRIHFNLSLPKWWYKRES